MKQKRIKCTYSNVLRIRLTHTMIPGSLPHDPLLLQNQADGMDVVAADKNGGAEK
jgi:hypothetical protein